MIRRLLPVVLAAAVFSRIAAAESEPAKANPDLATILSFEGAQTGTFPLGWQGGPRATIALDHEVVHGGKAAVRIMRTAGSEGSFSSVTASVPMNFAGKTVELRGFLRTADVTGFAGFWLREDGNNPGLEFDNMEARHLQGTTPWTEYSVSLPLNPAGKTLFFGVLGVGTGQVWADDLQLLVDGRPVGEAPKRAVTETAADRDHEFDAGSRIVLADLTAGQIENLAALGELWGFLKYHHPKITSGQLQWDYELFRILPRVLAAPDRAAACEVFLRWIDGLGAVKPASPPAMLDETSPDLQLRPPVAWIHDRARWGAELSDRLQAIYAARPANGAQAYVSLADGIGNPVFAGEVAYPERKNGDAGFRLLALFRLWNIVRYWSPYRDLVAGDWDSTLAEFIPRLVHADSFDAYQLELLAFIGRIRDTHASLWSSLQLQPPVGRAQLPVVTRFVGPQAVVSALLAGPDSSAGLFQSGDIITDLDGKSVAGLVAAWSDLYPASNSAARFRDLGRNLTRGPPGKVAVGVERGGIRLQVEADRRALPPDRSSWRHDRAGPTFCRLGPEVAYLKLSSVKAAEAAGYVEQAAGTKGMIIDLRNYPSEFVVFALGSHLVEKKTDFVSFTIADLANPGAFFFGPKLALEPRPPFYHGRLVILVDETTQSQAEYTAMAFRVARGAKVVGGTTAGADGNVSPIYLPGGLSTMISGIGVYDPDRHPTQGVGIVPDIEVRPTVAGLRAGRDEILEEGLRQILGPEFPEEEIRELARTPAPTAGGTANGR